MLRKSLPVLIDYPTGFRSLCDTVYSRNLHEVAHAHECQVRHGGIVPLFSQAPCLTYPMILMSELYPSSWMRSLPSSTEVFGSGVERCPRGQHSRADHKLRP